MRTADGGQRGQSEQIPYFGNYKTKCEQNKYSDCPKDSGKLRVICVIGGKIFT